MCNFLRTTGTYLLKHYLPHVTGQLGGALPAPCDGSVVWRIICPTRWVSVEWHVTSPKHRVWLFQALAVSSVALLGPGYYQFWGLFVKCQTNLAHFLILLQNFSYTLQCKSISLSVFVAYLLTICKKNPHHFWHLVFQGWCMFVMYISRLHFSVFSLSSNKAST